MSGKRVCFVANPTRGQVAALGVLHMDPECPGVFRIYPFLVDGRGFAENEHFNQLCGAVWERLIPTMLLLDNTVGVSLEPAPVSRQVRRQAQRTRAQIALTVTIRQPTRRPGRSGNAGSVDYSHRFERRAQYRCMTSGPHFKPDKLSSWCPRHGAHACRCEFVQATIVGPADKPFIPKVRSLDRVEARP